MKEQLIHGRRSNGDYYVRPMTWAGIWDVEGNLHDGNTLFESESENECITFIKGYEEANKGKE